MYRVMVPAKFCGTILHYARKGRIFKTVEKAAKAAKRERDAYVIDDKGLLVDYPTKPRISAACRCLCAVKVSK